jgi:ABC-type uncharacterized transport system ATPase subunit
LHPHRVDKGWGIQTPGSCVGTFRKTSNPLRDHVPLHQPVHTLAAGEKQRLEILKQLYLGRRLLFLDEPTSVLTVAEWIGG